MDLAYIDRIIRRAKRHDIILTREDFKPDDTGDPTLDGMVPEEWLDSMTMD